MSNEVTVQQADQVFELTPQQRKRREPWVKVLFKNPLVVVSSVYLLSVIIAAIFAQHLTAYPTHYTDIQNRFIAPGPEFLLGTDHLGRDVLTRIIYGTRVTVFVGVTVTASAILVGVTMGMLSGFYRKVDEVVMRVTDLLMAFPPIIAGLTLMAIMGPSVRNVIIALFVVSTPRVARLARGETIVLREQTFVKAAQFMKAGTAKIIFKHILPNIISPIIIYGAGLFAATVIAEASLSFLGIGTPPDVPSWGTMLSEGRFYVLRAWWLSVVPGIAIFLTVLSLNLFGDGLRDVRDPRQYGR